MKKCPPGVICIENISLFFIVVCVAIVSYILYHNMYRQNIVVNNNTTDKIVVKEPSREKNWFGMPNIPYNNLYTDVLLNPYSPPLRDERYLVPPTSFIPGGAVPINISTSAIDTNYRQVGILTPLNGKDKNNILPLMGRILFNRRDLWNYYTISNQHNNVKLPISVKGKSALNDNGVDRLYNGDTVYIEGINDAYKATIYDNDTIRYLPSF